MQQLQEVEQLPTALRASAAEVRAHLIGEPIAFLDLPPTARDMTPDDPDAAPAGRGVRSLGAAHAAARQRGVARRRAPSHADEIAREARRRLGAEIGAKLVGGVRRGVHRRPSSEGAGGAPLRRRMR